MIATLETYTDFRPVPRVAVALAEVAVVDGGNAAGAGDAVLDGGGVAGGTGVADGGSASLTQVVVPDGTDNVTLWRRSEGRAFKVRGVVGRAYQGTLGVLDMEAPFGVASSYELECRSGEAPLGSVQLGRTELPPLEGPAWQTLIQQPLNPNLHAVVEEADTSGIDVNRSAAGVDVLPEAAGLPTVIGFGPRRGVEGVDLQYAVNDRETAARVWATLGTEDAPQLQVWLVRSQHPMLPRVFFCSVPDLRESSFNVHLGGQKSRFRATVTEVSPPAPALVTPTLTYTDLAAALGGTYSGIAAALPRYSEWATAWEYSGAAG